MHNLLDRFLPQDKTHGADTRCDPQPPKATVSLARVVEAAGIALTPHGKDLLGLCPFHADHDPSLVITPSKNLWHCLGACQRGGSVIDWVMLIEAVSFQHAVELLLSDYAPAALHAPVAGALPPGAPAPCIP
ncbi:MAG: hypothetical protein HY080_15980 [Gammaproteobacteria bacterium]|nr:hypothetical protein [Gammaproteobacteria bacterium]